MKYDPNRLEDLLRDRRSLPSYVVGFLRSFRQAAFLICSPNFAVSTSLPNRRLADEIACLQAIVFAVRSLETLMRDCFVTSLSLCSGFRGSVAATNAKISLQDVERIISHPDHPDHFNELLASQRSFQDLDAVNSAFKPLLGVNLFDYVDKEPIILFRCDRHLSFFFGSLSDVLPDWRKSLYQLYRTRHEIIHNAHYRPALDPEEVISFLRVALAVGQFAAVHIGHRLYDRESQGLLMIDAPASEALPIFKAVEQNSLNNLSKYRERAPQYLETSKDFNISIGPFLFRLEDLLITEFEEQYDHCNSEAPSRPTLHVVERTGETGYVVKSLRSIAKKVTS